jgi:hypothetical protein
MIDEWVQSTLFLGVSEVVSSANVWSGFGAWKV